MRKTIDLVGMKFNHLTVLKKDTTKILPSGQHKTMWVCECDCGNISSVSSYALRHGNILSCKECGIKRSSESRKVHGKRNSRIYNIWAEMKQRCFNKNHKYYCNYGGRGITVCDEWIHDFKAFYDWAIKNDYSDNLTIDRIDNDKGYSPENCRWATAKEQANNTRRNKRIKFMGEGKTLSQWADTYGISQDLLGERLLRGIPIERAIIKNVL